MTANAEIAGSESVKDGVSLADVARWSILPIIVAGGTIAKIVHDKNKKKKIEILGAANDEKDEDEET